MEAGTAFKNKDYLEIWKASADFLIKEMMDPKGGFYGSYSANSEGKEGLFYLWKPDEPGSQATATARL